MSRDRSRRCKGIVSVELAMCMPVLVLLLVGGIHLNRVMVTQHRLSDAVDFATRAAAVGQITDAASIEANIRSRMNGEVQRCYQLTVATTTIHLAGATLTSTGGGGGSVLTSSSGFSGGGGMSGGACLGGMCGVPGTSNPGTSGSLSVMALQVTASCWMTQVMHLGPSHITATVAMPL